MKQRRLLLSPYPPPGALSPAPAGSTGVARAAAEVVCKVGRCLFFFFLPSPNRRLARRLPKWPQANANGPVTHTAEAKAGLPCVEMRDFPLPQIYLFPVSPPQEKGSLPTGASLPHPL